MAESLWAKILRAQRRTWENKRIPLGRRIKACDLLWRAAIREHLAESERRKTSQ
jgi:hypothetical protein